MPFLETLWSSLFASLLCGILLWWLLRDAVVRSMPIPSQTLVRWEQPRRRAGVRPPPWFWVFLAGLAMVFAGAAMPYVREQPETPVRVVVLVDTGLSSQAREGRTTRLDLARRAIGERLERLDGPERLFALVSASAFPTVEIPWTGDRVVLERRLGELTSTAAATDWTASLDLVRTLVGPDPAEVLVAGSAIGEPLETWRALHPDFPADLVPLPVGTSRPNRGIDGLTASVRRDPQTGVETTSVEVAVRGVGPGVSTAWMRQRSGLVIRSREGLVRPRTAGSTWAAAAGGEGEVLERCTLELDGRFEELSISLANAQDVLEVDDRAIVCFRPPPDVLVVDPRPERARRITERLHAAARPGTVDVLAELTAAIDLAAYDLLIANERIPLDPWPPVNTLVYADERDTEVVRFADYVPCRLTRYVNVVSPFQLRARAVAVDETMRAVLYYKARRPVTARAEPLVAWGEHEGRRKVAIGWDWVAAADDAHLTLSIVWLHALDWLGPEESRPGALWAGESFPAPPGAGALRLLGPAGVEAGISAGSGSIEPEALLNAGRYRLVGVEGRDLPFAVNARCADLRADEGPLERIPGDVSTPSPAFEEERREHKDLGWWIAAAALLAVELGVYLFSRRRPELRVTEA